MSTYTSENIRYLKDEELESHLKLLIGRERKMLHLILIHIQEVDRRKLYAARAFSSLHDYLTKVFGYSSSAAQRRIQTARLMTQVPQLSEKIQNGDVNLSQIGVVMQAIKFKESQTGEKLSAQTKQEIVSEICSKTSEQTQVLVAQKLDIPLQQPEKKVFQKDESCVLTITLTPEQQKNLQRCKELLAAKLQQQNKSYTTVNFLDELMLFFLGKKDPLHQNTKNQTLQMKVEKETPSQHDSKSQSQIQTHSQAQTMAQSTIRPQNQTHSPSSLPNNVSLPKNTHKPNLKQQIFQEWSCCQYQDPVSGRRCEQSFQLEMEHLQPRWAGGDDDFSNRTLLCRTHNQWKYRQQVGLS